MLCPSAIRDLSLEWQGSDPCAPAPAPATRCQLGAVAGGKAQRHHPAPGCDRAHRAQRVLTGCEPILTAATSHLVPIFPRKLDSISSCCCCFPLDAELSALCSRGARSRAGRVPCLAQIPAPTAACGGQSDLLGEIWGFSSTKKVSAILAFIIAGLCPCILPGCVFLHICSWGAGSCLGAWLVLWRRR